MLSADRPMPTPPIPNIAFQQNNLVTPTVQYQGNNLLFREILLKLAEGTTGSCQSVFGLVNSLEKQSISIEDFQLFLNAAHDLLVVFDSAKRSSLFRAIRYSISSIQHVQVLKDEDIHYLVVNAFERESDNTMERIQALKIMDRIRRVCGPDDGYPIAFARSLISIANSKEDNFRKIALESLRELSLSHPSLVAAVQGFSTLVDAIVDPVSQEIADSITHTILFLLNDPSTRKIVSPCIDLKAILVSFTDLDSDLSDLEPRWQAAKAAFNIMMRSWVGIHMLVSDTSALPMMMNMLQDTKIPLPTQNAILDSIIEVLEPHFSRVRITGRAKRHSTAVEDSRDSPIPSSPSSLKLNQQDTKAARHVRSSSDSDMLQANANSSSASTSTMFINKDSSVDSSSRASISQSNNRQSVSISTSTQAMPTANKHFSISSLFSSRGSRNSIAKPSSTSSGNALSMQESQQEYTTLTTEQRDILRRASITGTGRPSTIASGGKQAPDLSIPTTAEFEDDFSDPIFNLLDNYTALMCCAFLHVDLISGLVTLGVDGTLAIAKKSRELLVKFVKMLANILPENLCADLLTNPSLIDFAATLDPKVVNLSKAHKSSQLLLDIAEAFSLMPYKQTSGTHVSNLSSYGNSQSTSLISTRNRTGSVGTSKSAVGLPGASSNKDSSGSGAGAGGNMYPYNGININGAGLNAHHSNFQSLNIQTLYELAEEIKISSFSTISSQPKLTGDHVSTTSDVIDSLRLALTPIVDKVDFIRQMDVSRVIGKEGKEPFKWDWLTISDMLEYSFQHQDRLVEALKTKWVRRISGFFRCSVEEKGYFANLEWDPTNLQYLECACHLYSVLLHDENGMAFLTSDRRGMLFNEIARELEQLTISASSTNAINVSSAQMNGSNAAGVGLNVVGGKNVFRLNSCNTLMAREYFALLGRIVRSPNSRKLLDHTNIFKFLSQLGQYPSLDYICRLAITSLSFTDGGMMSKHLLQLWTTQINCTPDNKNYYHTLLRVLLHSFAAEVEQQNSTNRAAHGTDLGAKTTSLVGNANYQWCLETIVSQLSVDDNPSDMIIKSLNEAIQNRNSLKTIVSKRPKIIDEPLAQDLLVRFLAVPEGIDYLNEKGWMDRAFSEWQETKSAQYVFDVEERISLALMASLATRKGNQSSGKGVIYSPSVKVTNSVGSGDGRDPNVHPSMVSMAMKVVEPIPIKIPDTKSEQKANTVCSHHSKMRRMDANDSLVIDLHGFLRIPWNMEMKVSNQSNIVPGDNSVGEFVRMDTFLDATDMASPLSFEISSDSNRLLKVRGLVLDGRGLPSGKMISPNMTILVTLMTGVCPVFKSGRVQPFSDTRGTVSTRRRTSTSATAAANISSATATGRSSVSVNSGSPHTIPGAEESTLDQDLPISFGQEGSYEWFVCKPSHRQGQLVQDGDSNRYFLALPGDPVVFVFEKRQIQQNNQRTSRSGSISKTGGENSNWTESGRLNSYNFGSGGINSRVATALFLVEIQYFLRFETGTSIFVPMPRHMYGELSRTIDGCTHLARRSIVTDFITKVRSSYDLLMRSSSANVTISQDNAHDAPVVKTKNSTLELRSLLWSLGHIGSSEHGFKAIDLVDPAFVDWCIDGACNSPHFTVRATFFYVLGLISRCSLAARKLSKKGWDYSPHGSNSAVAFPQVPGVLFRKLVEKSLHTSISNKKDRPYINTSTPNLPYANATYMNAPKSIFVLTPFINADAISKEQEALNIICKMPGVILYRDCKSRLESIKRDYPHVFSSRALYIEVLKILESYTFKLTARRDIIALFTDEAKKKNAPIAAEVAPLSTSVETPSIQQ